MTQTILLYLKIIPLKDKHLFKASMIHDDEMTALNRRGDWRNER